MSLLHHPQLYFVVFRELSIVDVLSLRLVDDALCGVVDRYLTDETIEHVIQGSEYSPASFIEPVAKAFRALGQDQDEVFICRIAQVLNSGVLEDGNPASPQVLSAMWSNLGNTLPSSRSRGYRIAQQEYGILQCYLQAAEKDEGNWKLWQNFSWLIGHERDMNHVFVNGQRYSSLQCVAQAQKYNTNNDRESVITAIQWQPRSSIAWIQLARMSLDDDEVIAVGNRKLTPFQCLERGIEETDAFNTSNVSVWLRVKERFQRRREMNKPELGLDVRGAKIGYLTINAMLAVLGRRNLMDAVFMNAQRVLGESRRIPLLDGKFALLHENGDVEGPL